MDKQGDLYLISIGVSHYQDTALSLNYADNDAREIYQQLTQVVKGKYKNIHATLLTDGEEKLPTADNIRTALKTLSTTKPEDTTIIFLAGHGVNEANNYYFLPRDVKRNEQWENALHWSHFQDTLQETQGRRLLFIDTCYAGAALSADQERNPSLLKNLSDDNIIVIAATDYETPAQETHQLKHGVLAYSLLEGLKGKADSYKDKSISFKELDAYVSNHVKDLTSGAQTLVSQVPPYGFKDFELVRLN